MNTQHMKHALTSTRKGGRISIINNNKENHNTNYSHINIPKRPQLNKDVLKISSSRLSPNVHTLSVPNSLAEGGDKSIIVNTSQIQPHSTSDLHGSLPSDRPEIAAPHNSEDQQYQQQQHQYQHQQPQHQQQHQQQEQVHEQQQQQQQPEQPRVYKVHQHLKLPPASDKKAWQQFNKELTEHITARLPLQELKYYSINTSVCKFLDIVYWYTNQQFGHYDKPDAAKKERRKEVPDKLKQRLREQKREVKREWKKAKARNDLMTRYEMTKKFRRVIKALNKVRRDKEKIEKEFVASVSRKEFKKDPYKFSQKLFNTTTNLSPTFTKEEADVFFTKTYQDPERTVPYETPHQLKALPQPDFPFNIEKIDNGTLSEVLSKKSNGSAPGWDGIPYLIYKKCTGLHVYLLYFFEVVLTTQEVPIAWKIAFIILLSKSDITNKPDQFRPIALGNTMGKIFFTIIQMRTTRFVLDNKFISIEFQKAFLPGIAGCVEHTQTLNTVMKDAKEHHRAITVTWLDLWNAYGSVRHSFIKYATERNHFPLEMVVLLENYYTGLTAHVVTEQWESEKFTFEIGMFQGCTLSTILFNIVYYMLKDWIAPINVGYTTKDKSMKVKDLYFADDTTYVTGRAKDNQLLLEATDRFFTWSVTMKPKPSKCVCLAFARFNKGAVHKVKKLEEKAWAACDPELKVGGDTIPILWDKTFKFLGRKIHMSLSEEIQKQHLLQKCLEIMQKIHKSHLTGVQKLWVYNFYATSLLSWELMIYDFARTVGNDLEVLVQPFLKVWAGLAETANANMLYLPTKEKGLGLKNLSTSFVQMQVSKMHLIKHSQDEKLRALYDNKKEKLEKKKRWNPIAELEDMEKSAYFDKLARGQTSRAGLGINHEPGNSVKEQRKVVLQQVKEKDCRKRLTELHSLALQGKWVNWDKSMWSDKSWTTLLYYLPQELFEWSNNAQLSTLPTPDNLRRWSRRHAGSCELCQTKNINLQHILNCCSFALHKNRYKWRHDGILSIFAQLFQQNLNSLYNPKPKKGISFVRQGERAPATSKKPESTGILSQSNDWKMTVDLNNQYEFPFHIIATALRPDIVIWSAAMKIVVLVELTVPLEERTAEAQKRKLGKYDDLVTACKNNGYEARTLTLEVGSRGWVAPSVGACLKILGFKQEKIKKCLSLCSTTAVRLSYLIYVNRNNKKWVPWEWTALMVPNYFEGLSKNK